MKFIVKNRFAKRTAKIMDNGQLTMDNVQWIMYNGQLTMDNVQCTMDN